MVIIQNKRLMLSEGMESNFTSPNLNDFMFFGGGGKGGGGGTRVVYVPQVQTVKETVVKKAPDAVKQEGASSMTEGDVASSTDDETIRGRSKTLGGTRKLAIPVTPSR